MFQKIKRILKSLREYKVFAIITPIFMIGEVVMECILPSVMSDLLNALELREDILPYIIAMIIIAVFSLTFGILGGLTASKASAGLAKNLRYDMYKKIQSFSFANIDRFSVSSLVTRLTTDVSTVQMAFQMCIRAVVRAPLMMIFSTVMAFVKGGVLAFIFVALIPAIGLVFFLILRKAMPTFSLLFKRYDAMNESIKENVSAIRVVKSYVREDYERAKFKATSDSLAKDFIKVEKIVAWNMPALNFAIHLSNMLICSFGSYLIYSGSTYDPEKDAIISTKLSLGEMSALQTYGVQILMSLMFISMILVMLAMSIEGMIRIDEVLAEEPTIKDPENPVYEIADGSVVFNNVNFKYNENAEKNAIEDMNFSIKSGEFVGIIGSTGSGKTSLVNLISRLYDTTTGEVLVGGRNVKEYDLKALRDSVSVVLQKNVLFSGTIAENLRWGDLNATDEEVQNAAKIAQADEFVQTFPKKYDTYIEQGGSNVSGGQKQRLCIARALLKKPKILILDDSTSAVDTKTDKLIRESLRKDIPNTTKIVIAQRISSIEDADKIIVLDNGRINAIGTHEQLLNSNPIYRDIYLTQTKKGGN